MHQRKLRLALVIAIIGTWFGFLGWMALTSSKPPTQRGADLNIAPTSTEKSR